MRGSGILMHITSLPSDSGIGTLGKAAYEFADFLKKSGQSYWQILPVNPTGFGDSPYQALSAFAGNPYLIDLDILCEEGLLKAEEYRDVDWGSDETAVDYGRLFENRISVLKNVVGRFAVSDAYSLFCSENSWWLDDYARFAALKEANGNKPWFEWSKNDFESETAEFYRILQFLFYKQWTDLKRYINSLGIRIIGDLPIYVAHDSAEVWGSPQYFELNSRKVPVNVAGVPPDSFSAEGQLWGNPVYDWDYIRSEGFEWWIKRISHALTVCDVIRIDHFRGFSGYYSVPYGSRNAVGGMWRKAPGSELFKAVEKRIGKANIIAEDLGFVDDGVKSLLRETGFPGMKILQFAFDSRESNDYLPHNYPQNCVVYVGTHDNETLAGWFESASRDDVEFAKKYLRLNEAEGLVNGTLKAAMASVADTVILTMQDLLSLGTRARMNIPSVPDGNWKWRAVKGDFSDGLADYLFEITKLYDRLN